MNPPAPLHQMFSEVPTRYDRMNRLLTWGLDARWRRSAADCCLENRPGRVLDLCCGTGDLALELAKRSKNSVVITGLDYSETMLDLAQRKLASAPVPVTLVRGEVASLPFETASFDCVGVSFAFRNLTWKNPLAENHVAEIARVLVPKGRLVILESSQPSSRLVKIGFQTYLRWFIAGAGAALSGTPGAYRYLANSARSFYTPLEIAQRLRTSGFATVVYKPFLLGAVGLHCAERC